MPATPFNWKVPAGRALEAALNRALALDEDTRAGLRALDGRSVALTLASPPLALQAAGEVGVALDAHAADRRRVIATEHASQEPRQLRHQPAKGAAHHPAIAGNGHHPGACTHLAHNLFRAGNRRGCRGL